MINVKIVEQIRKVQWWHSIDLKEYGVTRGVQGSIMYTLHMPEDLTGKTILDIGTVDGFYAFKAEERNAKRVLAVDSLAWRNKQYSSYKHLNTGKDGFNLARKILNSKVEDLEVKDFETDISVEKLGKFDVVLCLGILYHMKDPFGLLRRLSKMTKELLILETHTDMNGPYAYTAINIPLMAFYPKDELNKDATNWWGPNICCCSHMLEAAGFKEIDIKFLSQGGRAVFHAYKKKNKEEKKNV